LGTLIIPFMMAVLLFCVCAWGAVSIVGGFGAPPSRLATVESSGGGGGNEPTEEEGVLVKVVSMTKGRVSARHSNEGLGWPGGYPGSCSVMSFIRVGVF